MRSKADETLIILEILFRFGRSTEKRDIKAIATCYEADFSLFLSQIIIL